MVRSYLWCWMPLERRNELTVALLMVLIYKDDEILIEAEQEVQLESLSVLEDCGRSG